tara:strand:+ start:1410 stop:2999 length:1590 start_codon:yes stop_codon:yes gene_type:complete
MPENFDPQESALIGRYFTNLDKDIFCLVNLPEVVKGTLFSRYSRTEKTLRRVLLDEFINAPEMEFDEIVGSPNQNQSDPLLAIEKAERFYDRVLVGYGDDSVAELAGVHIACENISSLAADYLTNPRIGISPLEKSARYVMFDEKVDGDYLYYKDPSIMASKYSQNYIDSMRNLFESYRSWIYEAMDYVREVSPQDSDTSDRAYASAVRAKGCDIVKNILPASRLTNVGLFGNGRAYEYLISSLYSTELSETQEIGNEMHNELRKVIPSFVKRSQRNEYLVHRRSPVQNAKLASPQGLSNENSVTLVDFDDDAEKIVASTILYPHSQTNMGEIKTLIDSESSEYIENVIKEYVNNRSSRRDRPGRPFENVFYTFEFLSSYGVYRDFHRHRQLTQEAQILTPDLGYDIPIEVEDMGLEDEWNSRMDEAAEVAKKIADSGLLLESQYALPRQFKVRWYMKMNLREIFHMVELRSGPQGHPDYRKIAQSIYHEVQKVHPVLASGISFVDLNEYALPRLDAEKRLDVKRARLK